MKAPADIRGTGLLARIEPLRRLVLAGDNRACFIERETLLPVIAQEAQAQQVDPGRLHSFALSRLLSRLSTPIDAHDVILGRMVEGHGPWSDEYQDSIGLGEWTKLIHCTLLGSPGHQTYDYAALLEKGFHGIAADAAVTAQRLNTPAARLFADNAAAVAVAVEAFARRYAVAARLRAELADEGDREHLLRAAAALEHVPHGPAKDFFSALQSIWMGHFLISCVIGARDAGFGRLDLLLRPYYERGIADGSLTHDAAVGFLAHFLVKTNEICGTVFHKSIKPVPSQSSKQYIILGGRDGDGVEQANDLSLMILDAAQLVRLTQPSFIVRTDPDYSREFKLKAAEAASALQGQVHFSNDDAIPGRLEQLGVTRADAWDYGHSACSRIDIGPRHTCNETYVFPMFWLMDILGKDPHAADAFTCVDEIIAAVGAAAARHFASYFGKKLSEREPVYHPSIPAPGPHFHTESLLLRDCVARGLNYCEGGTRYVLHTPFIAGIADLANSLMAIQRLVFEQRRMTLSELMAIVNGNFAGHEALRAEIVNTVPKYGNDDATVDGIAARLANALLDALESVSLPPGHLALAGFYCLIGQSVSVGKALPATPDGRLRGEPISENQSPAGGTDLRGVTAMLKSVSALPLRRAPSGCLNVGFSGPVSAPNLVGLLDAYFRMGGAFLAINFVDRATLLDAQARPEKHRSLYVRIQGFSEYFTAIPAAEQQVVIDRTGHAAEIKP